MVGSHVGSNLGLGFKLRQRCDKFKKMAVDNSLQVSHFLLDGLNFFFVGG